MDNKQALVAAAYHEAVDAIKQEVLVDTTGPDIYNQAIERCCLAISRLTPTDAEEKLQELLTEVAFRSFGLGFNANPKDVARLNDIVDSVLKRTTQL